MGEPVHFSNAIESLLLGPLSPGNRPHGSASTPPDLTNDDMRIEGAEEPADWLRNIAKRTSYANLLAIEEHVAVVAEIRWEGRVLTEAHCQAVALDSGRIEEVLNGTGCPTMHYLRADFEPWNLGQFVFPDPVSHVHSNHKKEPRFRLAAADSVTHVDFFELVLRNFARATWQTWAEKVWHKRVRVTMPGSAPAATLSTVRNAFEDSDYKRLSSGDLRPAVRKWKQALRREKGLMTTLAADSTLAALDY